jgi:hypothetical protein
VEEMLSETCDDSLPNEPSDVVSESDDDDSNDNESYSDFEPEITRKIIKPVCHLSSDSETGSAQKEDNNNRSEIHEGGGLQHGKNKLLLQN